MGKIILIGLPELLKFIHCILVVFGRENYGEYARSLKRFSFIAIQHLRWLWTFLGISNSGNHRIFIRFAGNSSNNHEITKYIVKSWLPSALQYRISNIILIVQCISGAA